MQKFIAKYALAAHLALVAVAPLMLSPFFAAEAVAITTLYLAAVSLPWLLMEPSVRGGETPHEAFARALVSILHDPLFWTLLLVAVLALVRWLNGGIEMAYASETQNWTLAEPVMPMFPGVAEGHGFLELAGAVAALVVVTGARHSLGRSARIAFLLVATTLSGLAGIVAAYLGEQPTAGAYSFAGVVYGLFFVLSMSALVSAFERRWNLTLPIFMVSIGGNAVGLFTMAPEYASVAFAIAAVLTCLYAFVYALRVLRNPGEFKYLVFVGLALALGVVIVQFTMSEAALSSKLETFANREFFSEQFLKVRETLSAISFVVWKGGLWTGRGIGAFPLCLNFHATAADWAVIPQGVSAIPNGYWMLLAERGLVGALAIAVPAGMLAFTYLRRACSFVRVREWPQPDAIAVPFALFALIAVSLFDCSFLRIDALVAIGAAAAIGAKAFPKERRNDG